MGDLPAREPPERPGAAPLAWGPEFGGPGNSSAPRISGFRGQFVWADAQLPSATHSDVAAGRFAGLASPVSLAAPAGPVSLAGHTQVHVPAAIYPHACRFRADVRICAYFQNRGVRGHRSRIPDASCVAGPTDFRLRVSWR